MATRTITNGGGAWNVAGTWVEGVVPTAADDVVATITSGNLSIPSGYTALCRSINLFGFTGTFTHATGSAALTIGTSTPGPSNVALFFPTSLTYTNGTSTITFNSTLTTQQTIDFGGKTPANWTVNAPGGSYILGRDTASTAAFTLIAGTFDTGNYAVSVSSFSVTGSPSKTLTLGSSAITLTGAGSNIIYASTATNLTISANTSTWSFDASGGNSTILGGGYNWGGASLVIGAAATGGISHNNIGIWKDYTRTGGALRVDVNYSFSGTTTFTGVLTLTGNSEVNRIFAQSGTVGTPAMITAAAVSLTNVDFMDIAFVGTAGSTITSDAFTRANGALNGSASDAATGGSGAVWGTPSVGTWTIASNVASGNYNVGSALSVIPLPAGSRNVRVEAKMPSRPSGGNASWDLAVAYSASTDYLYIAVDQAGNTRLAIMVGGVASVLNGNQSYTTAAAADVLALEILDALVVIRKNGTIVGTTVLTPTQSAALTGTSVGLGVSGSLALTFDDLKVTNVARVSGTVIGDAQGNSGITFRTPQAHYGVSAGNASATTTWSTTSGGAAGSTTPLPQDDVILNAASGSGTYTFDLPRVGRNVNCAGFTGIWAWPVGSFSPTFYGSLTLSTAMAVGGINTLNWLFAGRGSHTITTAGKPIFAASNTSGGFAAVGGTYTMMDAMSWQGNLTLSYGTLDTNGYTLTITGRMISGGSGTRSLVLGTSIVYILSTSTSAVWQLSGTNMTMSAASSTIVFSTATVGNRGFDGAGFTYGTVTYTVANSPGTFTITGANTIGTLNIGPGRQVTSPAGVVQTIGVFNPQGQKNDFVYLPGIAGQYISAPDSAATSVTGDLDIRVRVALPDWTGGGQQALFGKWNNTGNQRSYTLILTNGSLQLGTSSNGTLNTTTQSSVAMSGLTAGSGRWLRATYQASTRDIKFYTAPDSPTVPSGAGWTQLGTTQAAAGQTSLFDSTALVEFGSISTGTQLPIAARFYRGQIINNILDNGTGIVFDADFSTKAFGAATFTESSVNAATVTANGVQALAGDGRVAYASSTPASPTLLSLAGERQSFDYLVLQDVYSAIPYKFYAGANSVNVSGNTGITFSATPTAPPEPYVAFNWEAQPAGSVSSVTVNLTGPPGQSVQAGDALVVIANYTTSPGTVAAIGYSHVSGSPVVDPAAATATLFRKADGSETSVTITNSTAVSAGSNFRVLVVRGLVGDPQIDVVDSAVAGGASVTALSTGSGVTNTAAPAYAIASWGSNGALGVTVSVTGGYQFARSASDLTYSRVAGKPLTASGSNTSTLTWTTARVRVVGRMVVLKSTPTGNQAGLLAFFM